MKDNYNDFERNMEIMDMNLVNLNENEKDEKYLKDMSFIIMSKIQKKKGIQRKWNGKIEENQWFSFTNYLKVLKVN